MDTDILRQRFLAKTWGAAPFLCLLWKASTNPGGYGKMLVDGRLRQATHIAFLLKYGHWPRSRLVRHTCDLPRCVQPDHLLEGTHKDNHDDMKARGRSPRGERHGMAKLTNSQADQVRRAEGIPPAIAYWFGISVPQVYRIKRGASRACD